MQCRLCAVKEISIHALREEGDLSQPLPRSWPSYFYPRPPRGGRLQLFQPRHGDLGFLSTPSARRATRMTIQYETGTLFLSTPSARRATPRPQKWPWYKKFLSTPSARRATPNLQHLSIGFFEFLSTPSARRATRCRALLTASRRNFYPRPPRGGRRCAQSVRTSATIFLSTPSARRATRRSARGWSACINFYPRPPRGGRQDALDFLFEVLGFLSTPSARRATRFASSVLLSGVISIHALREEGDART